MRFFRRKPYTADRNWKYHQALRMCQVSGIRMGLAERVDGTWVYYLCDGKMWRFRKGRVVGPLPYDGTLWRSLNDGMRFTSISLRRFVKLI
jgi:CubicO group peptidase (beta-lactamase class C family)